MNGSSHQKIRNAAISEKWEIQISGFTQYYSECSDLIKNYKTFMAQGAMVQSKEKKI